jgi:hypothetical protein
MSVNFATPVAHQVSADYSGFNNAITIGRSFRQPLVTASNPNGWAPGLELFLSPAGNIADLFAWFDGLVSWQPAPAAGQSATLVLETGLDVLTAPGAPTTLSSLRTLEARPKRALYSNADEDWVHTALTDLLTQSFNSAAAAAATPANWHPCMRMIVHVGGAASTLFAHINANPPTVNAITSLVDGFINGAGAAMQRVHVRAGDRIGRAAPYLATDILPAAPLFALGAAGDANRARRLTFQCVDLGNQILNPLYYLHIYMRRMLLPAANRIVVSLTNIVDAGALRHPLVTLFPTLGNPTVPAAREQVGGVHAFPIGKLNSFHAFPEDTPISTLEWRYDDTLHFVAQAHVAGTPVPALATTPAASAKVANLWNEGANVNAICAALQVPVELVASTAGAEAPPDLNPRAVRLEPLLQSNRKGVAVNLQTEYDHVIGQQGNATAVVRNPDLTSRVDVTLFANDTIGGNNLRRKFLLVEDVDPLEITANTAGANSANYQITVRDQRFDGGSNAAGTQNAALTRFYSPVLRSAGQNAAAAAQLASPRHGFLRRMSVSSTQNTLDGDTTVTLLVNGADSALKVTLAAKALNDSDNVHEAAVATGDNVVIRVVTTGAIGQIRNLRVRMQFAPGLGGVWLLKEGFTVPAGVPNPWNGAGVVRAGRAMTWTQLIDLVNATQGARISPGILQTLISTAREGVNFVTALDPGIIAGLGLAAPPGNAGGFLNDWLLTAAHSLLAGIANIRRGYNGHSTAFDLPVVGGDYNAGSPQNANNTRWGLVYYGEYVEPSARHFNAAVDFFAGMPPPAPSPNTRFMR